MTDEELVEQIQQGINVQENMVILYKQTYKYIRKLVYPYSKVLINSIFDMNDLMQETYLNFHEAVMKFDNTKGVRFLIFVAPFVKLGAKIFIETKVSSFHIPKDKANLAWKYDLLKKQYGSQPDSFFAEQLNISVNRLSTIKNLSALSHTLSLDYESSDEDEEKSLHDVYASDSDVADTVIQEMVSEKLNKVWETAENICTDTEYQVIKGHFQDGKSFQELGQEMGKCAEIARRHNVKALKKLKEDSEIISIAELYFDDYDCKEAFHYGVERFNNTWESSTEHIAMKHLEVEPWLQEEGLQKIRKWKQLGMTKEQLAKRIGVHRVTLRVWCNKYPSIRNAVNAS